MDDLICSLLAKNIELIPAGDRLIFRGPLSDTDRETIRSKKQELLRVLNNNRCLGCRAAGFWDYRDYAGIWLRKTSIPYSLSA